MVGQFIQGKKALGDYATALANGTKGIPILGTFTELIAEGVTQLDSLNSVILELTNSGASFNGSMSLTLARPFSLCPAVTPSVWMAVAFRTLTTH